jgi:hypothetical protein
MGVFEQILETNKILAEQISVLTKEILLLKEQTNNKDNNINKLFIEFSETDILNNSMTAKVLGIKQSELDEIVKQGLLHSVGKRKRIFLAKDILEYKKNKRINDKNYNITPQKTKHKTKKRKKTVNNKINRIQLDELIRINNSQS